jgi:hypothetical protein
MAYATKPALLPKDFGFETPKSKPSQPQKPKKKKTVKKKKKKKPVNKSVTKRVVRKLPWKT